MFFVSGAISSEKVDLSRGEFCILPDEIPVGGASYSSKDHKRINKLCSYDMSITKEQEESGNRKAVAICPKLFSTFPAVELFKIPDGLTKQEFESNNCNREIGGKTKGKKYAKYKYSMSCSKTPSILGYFHVSRSLGRKFVPPAVLRSMDLMAHLEIAKKAERLFK